MKDKALRQALEFLEQLGENHWGNRTDVIAAIKEALAQAEYVMGGGGDLYHWPLHLEDKKPGWKRGWVNLTDEEISAASKGHMTRNGFARVVETKLKEKNT